MTKDEFLEKLRQTPRDWRITNSGAIRRTALVPTSFGGAIPVVCCPITSLGNPLRDANDWSEVADELGLDAFAGRIVSAADTDKSDDTWSTLRIQLLEACGLS